MSDEGVSLILRVALVLFMIVVLAFFRALVGPGKKRGQIMLLGTLGGVTFGVMIASSMSRLLQTDVSVLSAVLGTMLGWTVSWVFARRIPREAS
jgi:hypothetical protein